MIIVHLIFTSRESHEKMCTLDEYLGDNEPSRVLNLRNQDIHDLNIYSMIQPRIAMVLRVHLGKNNLGDRGARILSECLYTNNIITHLTLESNNIGNSGCCSISEWLSTNSSLRHLGLGGNHIGDYGCTGLSRSISEKKNGLQILVLCFNQISDSGFIDFCQQIQESKCLKIVIFWNNPITNLGGIELENMLKKNTTITRFEYNEDLVESGVKDKIQYHLDFNRLYQSEYPKKYLLTVSQFLRIWYYLSRNIHYYHISWELVRIIADFLGVSYFQSIVSWKQRLHQRILESTL